MLSSVALYLNKNTSAAFSFRVPSSDATNNILFLFYAQYTWFLCYNVLILIIGKDYFLVMSGMMLPADFATTCETGPMGSQFLYSLFA